MLALLRSLSLGDALVMVVTVIYAVASVSYARERNWASAVVFFGYALANVGVIWGLRR